MIVDTESLSEFIDGNQAVARVINSEESLHLPVIVLGEYRYGLMRSDSRRRLEAILSDLERNSILLPVTDGTAQSYAVVREELRAGGTPIPVNDVWIAALARQHGLPVASRDAHFDWISGLKRVAW